LIKEIDSRYINKIRQMGAGSIRSILGSFVKKLKKRGIFETKDR
jgi:hypothetical protein